VVAALQQRFRARRERGHWFRATPLELRQAIGDPEIVALYRSGEAKQRAAARLASERAKAEAAQALAAATVQERRRRRQQRRRTAARMLAAGSSQAATTEALAVSDRTIRNWAQGKAFQRALAQAQTRAQQQRQRAQEAAARKRATQELQNAAGGREPVHHSDQAQSGGAPPAEPRRPGEPADRAAAKTVAAGGGIEAIIEANGLRTRANVLTLIDPAILAQAHRNDTAQTPTGEPAPPG
jgi:hypothetical protein